VYLTATPDFSRLPNLEQLILKDCSRLLEIHHSIGSLCNLTLLNLKDCTSLSNLSEEIYKLKSLRTLILSGCSKIDLREKDIVQMKSLITLISENIAVKVLNLTTGLSYESTKFDNGFELQRIKCFEKIKEYPNKMLGITNKRKILCKEYPDFRLLQYKLFGQWIGPKTPCKS